VADGGCRGGAAEARPAWRKPEDRDTEELGATLARRGPMESEFFAHRLHGRSASSAPVASMVSCLRDRWASSARAASMASGGASRELLARHEENRWRRPPTAASTGGPGANELGQPGGGDMRMRMRSCGVLGAVGFCFNVNRKTCRR
jgi:hypothetical protein